MTSLVFDFVCLSVCFCSLVCTCVCWGSSFFELNSTPGTNISDRTRRALRRNQGTDSDEQPDIDFFAGYGGETPLVSIG